MLRVERKSFGAHILSHNSPVCYCKNFPLTFISKVKALLWSIHSVVYQSGSSRDLGWGLWECTQQRWLLRRCQWAQGVGQDDQYPSTKQSGQSTTAGLVQERLLNPPTQAWISKQPHVSKGHSITRHRNVNSV